METFTIIRKDVKGKVAYILWKTEPFIHLATDTFVVRNEKIMVQIITAFTT